jgi:hypothetical protein
VIVHRLVHNATGGEVGAGFLQSNVQLALPQALETAASITTYRNSPRTLSPTSRSCSSAHAMAPMPPFLRSFAEIACTALLPTLLTIR